MDTLRRSLGIYFGLIAIIPLFSVGGILFYDAYTELESEITGNFHSASETHGVQIRLLYDLRIQQITALAANPLFIEILQNPDTTNSQLLEILNRFEDSTGGNRGGVFNNIVGFYKHSVISENGDVVFSTDKSFIGTNVLVEKMHSVSNVVNRNLNQREMIITVPIFDVSSNSHEGYLQSVMGTKTTDHILLDSRLFETDETYLVNMDKIMMSESRFLDSVKSEIMVDSIPVQKCIDFEENHTGFYDVEENHVGFYVDYRGIEIFGSSYCASDLGFVLLHEMDAQELFVPLNNLVLIWISSMIMFGSLSVLFGLIISKKITLPIRKLKNSADEITSGNLDIQISFDGKYEIKSLAKSFDNMLQSLRTSKFEVETQKEIILENNRELKKIDVQKDEFAAMASHELKTPLVPIMGYLEMLLEDDLVGPLNEKQKTILEKSLSNVHTLQKLILQLLTVHRLEIDQVKWSISEFDVHDLMQTVYSDYEHLTQKKKITLTNLQSDPFTLSSDIEQIKEIFSNLMQNALDFTPEGGSISIDAKQKDDLVVFSVKDSGIGIPKEKQGGLFKKFYQVDTSVTRKHGGTGLGLSICRGLCEGLGGKIWVDSDEGCGSTFFFSILDQSKKKSEVEI
jgi:signal transduction histidine kinase